jgi:hypothetical protein
MAGSGEGRDDVARTKTEAPGSDEGPVAEADAGNADAQDTAPAPTPFDHPMFLPAMLFAFALWFGYDGFLNDDPDMMEHRTFNRGGFALWVVLLAWYGYRGLKEMREDAARADGDDRPDPIE